MRNLRFLICVVMFWGCVDNPPAYVFVPGENAKQTLTVSASHQQVAVGDPLVLHATRHTEGFVKVRYKSLSSDTNWRRQEPPAYEAEVADNLHWFVNPSGDAQFNTDMRKDHTREVRFFKPGNYILKASSAAWRGTATWSNTIKVEVVMPRE